MHDWYFLFLWHFFICRHIALFKIFYFYCRSTRDFARGKIFPPTLPFILFRWEILLCETEPRPLRGLVHWDEHLAQTWSSWAKSTFEIWGPLWGLESSPGVIVLGYILLKNSCQGVIVRGNYFLFDFWTNSLLQNTFSVSIDITHGKIFEKNKSFWNIC